MLALDSLSWPRTRLPEALHATASEAGVLSRRYRGPLPDAPSSDNPEIVRRWIASAARALGLEAFERALKYRELRQSLRDEAPMLIQVPGSSVPRFLALAGTRRGKAFLVDTDLKVVPVPLRALEDALRAPTREPSLDQVQQTLAAAGIPKRYESAAREALILSRLGWRRAVDGYHLRMSAALPLRTQLRPLGIGWVLGGLVGLHVLLLFMRIAMWYTIGRWAIGGAFDAAWMAAWLLLVLTQIPFFALQRWIEGSMGAVVGALLKRRLLLGALRSDVDEVRSWGVGSLVGRVLEANELESVTLHGGLGSFLSGVMELCFTLAVLALGAANVLHVLLLLAWVGLMAFLVKRLYRLRERWTSSRAELTDDLLERMMGHQTRIAQLPKELWHLGEAELVNQYVEDSERMDRTTSIMTGALARGFVLVGIVLLIPSYVEGTATVGRLAASLGGLLLGYSAFARLSWSVVQLVDAKISWKNVGPIYEGATDTATGAFHVAQDEDITVPETSGPGDAPPDPESNVLLKATDLTFRYRPHGTPVLSGADLVLRRSDRVILEGVSGSGKSTLVSLLSGLRAQESGLLLLNGMDLPTLGIESWRRSIASSPQFHENHVLAATFAFNLLMGRRWPALPEDLDEAEEVCSRLGLGDLLQRMPSGLFQLVGDTGWQLSHGERSRLYIARALLQKSPIVILDESLAALDPENLSRALDAALDRVPCLMVIAHP